MLAVVLVVSCQEPPLVNESLNDSLVTNHNKLTNRSDGDGVSFGPTVVLGDQLVSAYEVSNMREATEFLYPNLTEKEVRSLIDTTHLYIKIEVQDTAEYDALDADTTIDLYPYPLDYELISDGEMYENWEDAGLTEGQFPPLYTVVPKGTELSKVTHQVLKYAHIADQANDIIDKYSEVINWNDLEDEAWNLADTKNGKDTYQERRKGFQPRGRILVDESVWNPGFQITGPVPVWGIKVRARRGLKLSSTWTNSKGSFTMIERFRGRVRYSIEFERFGYKIVNAFGFSFNYVGPRTTSAWNHTFTWAGEEDWACATLVNAAGHFDRMADNHGLAMPSLRNVKIRPKFTDGRSNAIGMVRHFFPFIGALYKRADVRLYIRFRGQIRRGTDHLYQLVNHELAHVSHAEDAPLHFLGYGGAMLGESFATGIEWQFTRLSPYPWRVDGIQDVSRTDIIGNDNNDYKYSPMCVDLFDATNQFVVESNDPEFADDRINNISWSVIQDALGGSYGLSHFESRLVDKAGVDQNEISILMSFYEDIEENH